MLEAPGQEATVEDLVKNTVLIALLWVKFGCQLLPDTWKTPYEQYGNFDFHLLFFYIVICGHLKPPPGEILLLSMKLQDGYVAQKMSPGTPSQVSSNE